MAIGIVYHPIYLRHETDGHPESADRLRAIIGLLLRRGYLAGDADHVASGDAILLQPSPVPLPLLSKVHSPALIEELRRIAETGGGWIDPDTVVSSHTYEAALYAAGAMVCGLDAIYRGTVESAFALVRPPGHHATRSASMGFCIFNNVAVAAQYALDACGARKVLIVDWDLHHGNGTQSSFYDDPRVLYFSTHQYPFFPGTGAVTERGTGAGVGYTVNVPFTSGVGNRGALLAFTEVLVPVARRFRPDLVLVSAGYDTHWRDPLGGLCVTEGGFFAMAQIVRMLAQEMCGGRLLLTLEGGYDFDALAEGVVATLEALQGLPAYSGEVPQVPLWQRSERQAADIVEQARLLHRLV